MDYQSNDGFDKTFTLDDGTVEKLRYTEIAVQDNARSEVSTQAIVPLGKYIGWRAIRKALYESLQQSQVMFVAPPPTAHARTMYRWIIMASAGVLGMFGVLVM